MRFSFRVSWLVAKRSFIFSALFIILAVSFFLIIYLTADYFDEYFNWGTTSTVAIASLIITFGYIPMYRMLVNLTDRVFYLKRYDYYGALSSASERIRNYNDIEQLGNYIVTMLRELLKVEKVSLYLYDGERNEYLCRYYTGKKLRESGFIGDTAFIKTLRASNGVINIANNPDQADFLRQTNADIAVPIGKSGNLSGYLMLSRKLSGQHFGYDDERILTTMASHIYTAIEKMRLYTQLANKAQRLAKLNVLQKQIIYDQGKLAIYRTILEDITVALDAQQVILYTFNKVHNKMSQELHLGPQQGLPAVSDFSVEDLMHQPDLTQDQMDSHSVLVPVKHNNELMGALWLANRGQRFFSRTLDRSMLGLYCNYFGSIIKNVSLYDHAAEAKDYNETILRSINNIVCTVNLAGTIISVNESAFRDLALKPGLALLSLPELTPVCDLFSQTLTSRQEISNREIRLDSPINKDFTLSIKFIPGVDDSFQNVLIVLTDITEYKQLKLELLQKERVVTIANMASVIVHEIRNPLTSVGTLTKLMPLQHANSDYVELFSTLVPKELDRVHELMEDLLELSRTRKLVKEQLSIKTLLLERQKMLMQSADEKGVRITIAGEDILIYGHAKKLTQVFQNIMQNGIQSMDERGGELQLTIESMLIAQSNSELAMCLISISDQGSGMDSKTKANLFKPFFTTKETGTGLGLAITQKIIEDHGGNITVESELGAGTQFNILLPVNL